MASAPRAWLRPRRFALATAFTAALSVLAAQATAAPLVSVSPNQTALVSALVSEARNALALGYAERAIALVDDALSLSSIDADANYLRAALALSYGDKRAEAEAYIAASLSGANFRLYSAHEAELLYAGLLVRMKRPASALRFLAGKPRSAELLYLEYLAKRSLGDSDGARSAVAESLRRYPFDARPLIHWLVGNELKAASAQDAALVARAFQLLPELKELEPFLLVALTPYSAHVEDARLLLREYRAAGRNHPLATVLAFEAGLISHRKASEELALSALPIEVRLLQRYYALLSDDESRRSFLSSFSSFSGYILDDEDGDGIAEGRSLFKDGLLASWMYDQNQDGEPERVVDFSGGVPYRAELRSPSVRIVLEYGRWPFLSSATVHEGGNQRAYRFAPALYRYAPLELRALAETSPDQANTGPYLAYASGGDFPRERSLADAAYLVEERKYGGISATSLDKGLATSGWWRDTGGAAGELIYGDGYPKSEKLDLDGDGRYEARRVWGRSDAGHPQALYIEVDIDGDGLFEYRESVQQPSVRAWDLDADGQPDLFVERLENNGSLYSFSPSWRSRLPLVLRMDAGVVIEVRLGGVERPLIADSGGSVWWIGKKPFDFGRALPPEGSAVRDGMRYGVIRLGERYYAELLD
ncbi:MAG TPA: hypothetical protein DCG47_06725 [Spirochaetaceae bacterium]|nr:hypothetical protein [Spirochaetaceae bacterium]